MTEFWREGKPRFLCVQRNEQLVDVKIHDHCTVVRFVTRTGITEMYDQPLYQLLLLFVYL